MIQSLSEKVVVNDQVGSFGYLIIDNCHPISAVSIEQVVRQSRACYVTGLSATVARKDGHHPIIFMQCAPLPSNSLSSWMVVFAAEYSWVICFTGCERRLQPHDCGWCGQSSCWKTISGCANGTTEHLDILEKMLTAHMKNIIVMTGGMGKKQWAKLAEKIASIPADEDRVVLATRCSLGKGFEDTHLVR